MCNICIWLQIVECNYNVQWVIQIDFRKYDAKCQSLLNFVTNSINFMYSTHFSRLVRSDKGSPPPIFNLTRNLEHFIFSETRFKILTTCSKSAKRGKMCNKMFINRIYNYLQKILNITRNYNTITSLMT
jgi:hypothetical protein